jgi:hypothetical protein
MIPFQEVRLFFRVDTFRVRRSGSCQLPINTEAAPALLSIVFCLAMSQGFRPSPNVAHLEVDSRCCYNRGDVNYPSLNVHEKLRPETLTT